MNKDLVNKIVDALVKASQQLDPSLFDSLEEMRKWYEKSSYKASASLMEAILENLKLAKEHKIPMCQDTGMVVAFIEMGETDYTMKEIEKSLNEAIVKASEQGYFRFSVVEEPVFERKNSLNNLPAVIHWSTKEGKGVRISLMLKGFGSENCSAIKMLNPTAQEDEIIKTVVEMVKAAGSKPCPPIVVGVGLGGTSEQALIMAKKAHFRKIGSQHHDKRYALLEQKILKAINNLGIGPGGFKGDLTALSVAIEEGATHIASLPVAVSISCWADRHQTLSFGEEDDK